MPHPPDHGLESEDDGGPGTRQRPRLLRLVGRLSSVNLFIALLGLVTGPLQARALGPDGRGDLAAILVPLGLMPVLASLGLGTYAIRASARGRSAALLIGSLAPILLGAGLVVVLLAPLLAALFAGGRDTVYLFLLIGLSVVPVGLVGDLVSSIAVGRERWRTYIAVRLIPPLVVTVGVVVLFVLDRLTVGSAAALSIAASLLALAPLVPIVRGAGRPRFRREVAREGLAFGSKAWIGGLGQVANARLDQLLMTRLVPPSDLGLYVVAVTASGFLLSPVLGALGVGSLPRFSSGERGLITAVLRVSLFAAAVIGVLLALALPLLIPLVFGTDFSDAVTLAWVLLIANVPLAGMNVLSTALTGAGRPGFSAAAEITALAITIPGLIVLLPILGAMGAAVVSLAAYTASFTLLLVAARRHLGGGLSDYLLLRRTDAARFKGILDWRRGRGA